MPQPSETSLDFWHALIDEKSAAAFLGLTERTMQALRQRGGGPRYMRLSSRCVRYTREQLREWAEMKTQRSTSEEIHHAP